MIGRFVIIRTRDAGIHCGTLREFAGLCVRLEQAYRVWRWRGANTLHELSLRGADQEYTRISEGVEEIVLTEAIEVIPCKPEAQKNLSTPRWGAD